MREGIHPNYYQAKVVCNCGNEFVTGSTKEEIHVEICSKCHSFYTGQQKAVKARGAIDKFNRKYGMQANQYLYKYNVRFGLIDGHSNQKGAVTIFHVIAKCT